MITLRSWLSPCLFGFHAESVKEIREGKLHLICLRCLQVTGTPLSDQKYKARQTQGTKLKVISIAQGRRG